MCLIAYTPMWQNDFIDLDDGTYVTENNKVLLGLTADGIAWAWGFSFHAGYWIPITWMSMQFDSSLSHFLNLGGEFGVSAAVFHGQNLLWHIATCILLLIVLTEMTGRFWPSAFVAGLFAVHPLHVESVAWATERKDVLSTFFWMLTLLYYGRFARQPSIGRYMATLAVYILGLLAKPMLVTLPFVLLLLDYWPLRRWGAALPDKTMADVDAPAARRGLGQLVLEKIPFFLLAAGGGVLTIVAQQHAQAINTLGHLPISARLANAVASYGWYLEKTFWPTDLVVFYVHPLNDWAWQPVLISGGIMLAVTILALLLVRSAPWLMVGWFWFLGTFVPVIGLVQVGAQGMADRFVYVPHIGLFIAIVWSVASFVARIQVPIAIVCWGAASCLLALSVLTEFQVLYWKDSVTIWEHAVASIPDNHRAHVNLARQLLIKATAAGDPKQLDRAVLHAKEGISHSPGIIAEYEYIYAAVLIRRAQIADLEEAAKHLFRALRADPKHADAAFTLGLAQRRLKQYDQAAETFRKALKIADQPDTHAQLGMALWELGRREEARQEWETALRTNPRQAEALHGMGLVYMQQGKNREAAQSIQAALEADPTLEYACSNLGLAEGRLNHWDQAIEWHNQARLRSHPYADKALFLRRLALALHVENRLDEARNFYAESALLQSNWREANQELAWNIATSPNPTPGDAATAWELAAQASQALRNPSAADLDIEAATHAANGRFGDAASMAREAMKQASPEQAAAIAKRLALYEMRKAYIRDGK